MDVELTRSGKYSLIANSPVMPAAGTFGYGDRYSRLIKTEKLGAIVTNPVTASPRRLARGTHVIPVPGGLLLHTGWPNPGVNTVVKTYQKLWAGYPVPVIVHVMDRGPEDLRRCVQKIAVCVGVEGFELGIHPQASAAEAADLIDAVIQATQKPLLVRLPLERSVELCQVVAKTQAGAIVVGAPPRGMATDPIGGERITGRIFGPLVKPQALHVVTEVVKAVEPYHIPVIGAGGIHTPEDAREFILAGARAVQLDSIIWSHPEQAEIIARDLGGLQLTRASDAFADEWFPGMGDTFMKQSFSHPPDQLPE